MQKIHAAESDLSVLATKAKISRQQPNHAVLHSSQYIQQVTSWHKLRKSFHKRPRQRSGNFSIKLPSFKSYFPNIKNKDRVTSQLSYPLSNIIGLPQKKGYIIAINYPQHITGSHKICSQHKIIKTSDDNTWWLRADKTCSCWNSKHSRTDFKEHLIFGVCHILIEAAVIHLIR